MNREKKFEFMRVIISVALALIIAVIIISFVSKDPLEALSNFLLGPISSLSHIGNVIEMAIPLAFTGLAVSLLFKARLFNLGAEGIFYISGIATAYVAIYVKLPLVIHPLVAILAGVVVGAICSSIPGILKAKWNANELVTSLMFNYILVGIGLYILSYKMRDAKAYAIASPKFRPTAKLGVIIPGTRIHAGLIILIAVCIAAYYFLYKTKWGYEIRMLGINRAFAEYSGINAFWVIVLVHIVSGALAGLGGSVELLGMYNKFQWTSMPGYGLDGALVALLAKNNPASVLVAAIFLAYIRIGADMMARMSDVPAEMVAIVQAIIILLISADKFLKFWKERMLLKEAGING